MGNIAWGRVAHVIVIPFMLWAIVALATDAILLNPVLILVLISISFGVCVAFLPNVALFFRKDRPLDIFAVVALGIFMSWVSNIVRPMVPLIITLFPSMAWLRDTDFTSAGLCLAIYGGVAHLVAPAIDARGKIPSRRWATIGVLVGLTAGAALIVFNGPAIHNLWRRDEAGMHPAVFHGSPPEWMR